MEEYAFVIHPSRVNLKRKVDAALEDLRKSGELSRIRERFAVARDADWRCQLTTMLRESHGRGVPDRRP